MEDYYEYILMAELLTHCLIVIDSGVARGRGEPTPNVPKTILVKNPVRNVGKVGTVVSCSSEFASNAIIEIAITNQ